MFVFKPDGIPVGPIEPIGGGKDKAALSTRNGSFLLLDPTHVAISEQGMTTLTIYETDTGKRTKLVRKLPAPHVQEGRARRDLARPERRACRPSARTT